jgi:hypothetical protein
MNGLSERWQFQKCAQRVKVGYGKKKKMGGVKLKSIGKEKCGKGHKKSECTCGRPLFDGKDEKIVVAKLEQVFAIDGTVEEACSYASISRDSYYRYLSKHNEFRSRILELRERPVLAARQRAVLGIKESYGNAMDYLKRKRKDEFGDSPQQGVNLNIAALIFNGRQQDKLYEYSGQRLEDGQPVQDN